MIRLSFIIPLFNARSFIEACILSCLNCSLSLEEYEIIVWNDGSTDEGHLIVQSLQSQYKNIILIDKCNHGVSFSRNNALKLANGKYVWFVDSDDMVEPNQVMPLLEYAEKHDADMVNFCWKAFDGYSYTPGIHQVKDSDESLLGKELFNNRRLMMSPWCFIYKRIFLLENNLNFDECYRTCEDIQFNQKALFFAKRVLTSGKVAYIYRVQSESASQGKGRAWKVLKDQIRRVWDELVFFSPKGDYSFLVRVLYLNFREILLWTKLCIKS